MPPAAIDETKRIVDDLLQTHLPAGWGYRLKLNPRAEHLPPEAVAPNDLSWFIWRPEDIGDRFRYYRLELIGTTGNEFVIIHGNSDQGAGREPRPEMATVFTTWAADSALAMIIRGRGDYGPNQYGLG